MSFTNINKILVIKLRHIGDVLLSVPVFRALRENFPNAHISALVNSGTEEVLLENPLINEIIIFDRRIKKLNPLQKYLKELSFLKAIRARGFDMTVDLTSGDRAAVISLASGAGYRVGWRSGDGFIGKRYLYNHLSEPDGSKHMVLQNMEVVHGVVVDTGDLSVDLHIPVADKAFAEEILRSHGIRDGDGIVHIHPTSRWLFKCWRDEHMADVIGWLLREGIHVIITSSPSKREMEKARRILSLLDSMAPSINRGGILIDLCGKTTIKQLGALSSVSDLFFGVDSAPMHIAAAVGTPVVALFGPSGAFNWGPWDNESSKFIPTWSGQNSKFKNPYTKRNGIQSFGIHTVIQKDWNCIPCGKDGCRGSKISRCLDEIKAEDVINILKGKLNL